MNDAYQDIKNSTSGRKDQFNTDAGEIVKLYENLQSGNYGELEYNGTLNPKDILKNIGSAMLSEASDEANTQLLTLVARPMMAGYIGADSSEQSSVELLRDNLNIWMILLDLFHRLIIHTTINFPVLC